MTFPSPCFYPYQFWLSPNKLKKPLVFMLAAFLLLVIFVDDDRELHKDPGANPAQNRHQDSVC